MTTIILTFGGVTAVLAVLVVFWNRWLIREVAKAREAEENLFKVVHNLPFATVLLDEDNRMYHHNKRFLETFGYAAEEIPTIEAWREKAYPDEQYRQYVQDTWSDSLKRSIAEDKDVEAHEFRVTCKNGELRDIEVSGHFLGGRYLGTLIDNTERNRARESLIKAKEAAETANRAKSIFLANMSHELRTPLNAILGFSRMLVRDPQSTPKQRERVAIINRSGEHLLDMINDVLEVSKIEAGTIDLEEAPFRLSTLLEDIRVMVQSRARESELSCTFDTRAVAHEYLSADEAKLRHILINLLGNALKFTTEGSVILRAATEPVPEASGCCQIVLEVKDTGRGIDPAYHEKIFDPFFQVNSSSTLAGTGLGLSICKKYADLMGGCIEVESAVGKGSLFRVRLPAGIADVAETRALTEVRPRVIGLANGQVIPKIMVVDDNLENRLVLSSLLEEVGFSVLQAENGIVALHEFEKGSPDFVWMDMRMPVMDGYEAVRRLRQRPGGDTLPVVALSASAFKEQRPKILESGCDDMLAKPYKEHEIFQTMARFLEVEYVYEQDAAPATNSGVDLSSDMLARLPPQLLRDLDETTLALDMDAILEVIDDIAEQAPETARQLQALAKDFEFAHIRELLEGT